MSTTMTNKAVARKVISYDMISYHDSNSKCPPETMAFQAPPVSSEAVCFHPETICIQQHSGLKRYSPSSQVVMMDTTWLCPLISQRQGISQARQTVQRQAGDVTRYHQKLPAGVQSCPNSCFSTDGSALIFLIKQM
jgi:anthranilate/para-aminobenzoate synthase component II